MAKKLIKVKFLKDAAGIEKGEEREVQPYLALRLIKNKTAAAEGKEAEAFIKQHNDKKKKAQEAADKAAEESQKKKEAAREAQKLQREIDNVIGSGDREALNEYTVKQLLPFALGKKGIDENSKKAAIVLALIPDDNCTSC